MATHFKQRGFGALAQGHHVHARRHGKQDVAHTHTLTAAIACLVRGMMAAASLFRRFWLVEGLFEQGLDRGGRGLADHAIGRRCVVGCEQAGGLRRLAQQFGAGALAQLFCSKRFGQRVQRHGVDAGDDRRGRSDSRLHDGCRLGRGFG